MTDVVGDLAARWEADPQPYPASRRAAVLGLLFVPALPLAALIAFMLGSLLWGTVALVLVWAVTALWAWSRPSLRKLGAREPDGAEALRARNLLEGLAERLDVSGPVLYVIDKAEVNAAALRPDAIGVTAGFLSELTRTEQEAVLAHCLVRVADPSHRYSRLAVAAGPWSYRFAPPVGGADDVAVAALTRYPTGLASALEKVSGGAPDGPLWFASDAACHRDTRERAKVLRDL